MSEDFGNNIITVTDEDGNSFQLEHLDTLEMDGVFYMAFLPVDEPEDSPSFGIVILKTETGEDGDEYLVIPEDDEADRIYDKFMEELYNQEEN